mmetsp:Transcript_19451/g.53432  ORF Transcript_19451/g.53432 Transcript_19451/m.53432 type:complete len:244 (-) Transcript_19451:263-994(-)
MACRDPETAGDGRSGAELGRPAGGSVARRGGAYLEATRLQARPRAAAHQVVGASFAVRGGRALGRGGRGERMRRGTLRGGLVLSLVHLPELRLAAGLRDLPDASGCRAYKDSTGPPWARCCCSWRRIQGGGGLARAARGGRRVGALRGVVGGLFVAGHRRSRHARGGRRRGRHRPRAHCRAGGRGATRCGELGGPGRDHRNAGRGSEGPSARCGRATALAAGACRGGGSGPRDPAKGGRATGV